MSHADVLRCTYCDKGVSTAFIPVPTDTPDGGLIVRAVIVCPECIEERAGDFDRRQKVDNMKRAIPVTAIWLRRIGNDVQVLAEVDGRGWLLAITEPADAAFSHIAEGNGAYRWKPDPVTGTTTTDRIDK